MAHTTRPSMPLMLFGAKLALYSLMLATHLKGLRRDLDVVDPTTLEAMRESLFQRKLLPWAVTYDTCKRACPESWATAKDNDVLP